MSNSAIRTVEDYRAVRDALIKRAVEVLEVDSRVMAVWLSGSFGRGVDDVWSDFDLHVAVADSEFADFWGSRERMYRRLGEPILIQPEMPSNAQHGGRFQLVVYPGPVEFDWNIGPLSMARRPAESVLLFARHHIPLDLPASLSDVERRDQAQNAIVFFWAMAPIAVKYAARQLSRRASSQIDLLTGSYIQLWRLVNLPDGPAPTAAAQNRATEPELDRNLPRLGATITPASALGVIRDQCHAVEELHPALADLGVEIPGAMPEAVAGMIDLARQQLDSGETSPSTVYR
jgi:predicted nucleotidyltransferase